ncbi:MAG: UDP-N-acetylglucosamine 1-carboxyvinyltransferase [Rhodospirillaceae bacterium]|nr:UDP-N-acetylglucosamine 1-carboxyvinyltransferase [Rhodospirillaceae bacterium]
MDKVRIRGGNRLVGKIPVSGAKNAALPLMAASLLTSAPLTLMNVPALADIESMCSLLTGLGTTVGDQNGAMGTELVLQNLNITNTEAPYDVVRKMRASVLVLGPLLARAGRARVSLPGGCAIGNRPVDLHLKGLQELGATVELTRGYIEAHTGPGGRLRGAKIAFPTVSVGATENLMMAASLADGETVLINAAREPEIVDLADCLIAMGARIEGHGTDTIHIWGREALCGARYQVVPDRIEIGTYAIAACITGGELELVGARAGLLETVFDTLSETGASISETGSGIKVSGPEGRPRGVDVMTEPYPGFPTDLQAQMMAYMTRAEGASMITESIFENRFMHVPELSRMGANITVHQASALVRGVEHLTGAPVMATDLRASVSLVLAGLAAVGETNINRIYHLDRGYERLVGKLRDCGAIIERVAENGSARNQVA